VFLHCLLLIVVTSPHTLHPRILFGKSPCSIGKSSWTHVSLYQTVSMEFSHLFSIAHSHVKEPEATIWKSNTCWLNLGWVVCRASILPWTRTTKDRRQNQLTNLVGYLTIWFCQNNISESLLFFTDYNDDQVKRVSCVGDLTISMLCFWNCWENPLSSTWSILIFSFFQWPLSRALRAINWKVGPARYVRWFKTSIN